MLNPLQAASSFACDGCGHHASFHTLKNAEEEGENFAVEQMNAVHARGATIGAARKRTATVQGSHTRAITNGSAKRGVALLSSDDDGDLQLLDGDVMPVVKRTRGGA